MENDRGGKKIYGLLGRNISYSLSPFMHNAAFKHFDIPAEYRLFDIEEKDLDAFFHKLVSGRGISGINVTVPYKIKIREMLEACKSGKVTLAPLVKITGSLNTIKIEEKEIKAFNTDVEGFADSLKEDAGFDLGPPRMNIFIAGAGGAGRAICLFLGINVANKIYVYDVDEAKLHSLGKIFREGKYIKFRPDVFCPIESVEDIPGKIAVSDLVVNATPLGTHEGDPLPVDPALLKEGTIVYDLVYARETELVRRARGRGLKAVNGLGMLVNQGALAFLKWNSDIFPQDPEGYKEPLAEIKEIMRNEAEKRLKGAKWDF